MPRSPRTSRWCFTLNNPTEPEKVALAQAGIENDAQKIKYLIVGREVGDSGTPHLQGFVIFDSSISRQTVKVRLGSERYHLEAARGKSTQARDYCKKEGDYDEYGSFPGNQGKRNDIDDFSKWLDELDEPPTESTLSSLWPGIFLRYPASMLRMVELRFPVGRILPEQLELRPWQLGLESVLDTEPNDRQILWYTDEQGNAGKSFMCSYILDKYPDAQLIPPGKEADMAHTICTTTRIFLFDIPRSKTEFFSYAILEQLKNRQVFSPKYQSRVKSLHHQPHVIVFSNEYPDRSKLSEDRWAITNLRQL